MKYTWPKSLKFRWNQGKDTPRDILYYSQYLAGPQGAEQMDFSVSSHYQQSGEQAQASILAAHHEAEGTEYADLLNSVPQDPEVEAQEQTTLADILKAVNNCTASVHILKDQFGALLRQDLQKNSVREPRR